MKFFKIGALLMAGALVCSCSSKKNDANEENEGEAIESNYSPEEINTQEVEAALLEDNNTNNTEEAAVAEESTTTTATAEEPAKADASANTKEFDEFLASYEKYVNEYIDLAKKMKDGDVTVAAKLPALMNDAKEYADKISKIKDDLTSAQLKKFTELQEKLAKAMQ